MNGQTAHKVGCPLITPGIYGRFPRCTCGDAPTEMTSLTQIKARLAAIEQQVALISRALLPTPEFENREEVENFNRGIRNRLLTVEGKIDTFAINQVQVCKGIDGILAGQGVLCERLDAFYQIYERLELRLPTKLFAELASIELPLAAIHERLDTLEKMLANKPSGKWVGGYKLPKRRRK